MENKTSRFGSFTRSAVWNVLLLILSSFVTASLSLLLAIGNGQQNMFFDYYRYPLTFLLNYLPVLLLEALLWCAAGRLWIAYLISGCFILLMSAGNYFKMVIRYEPFLFSDIYFIRTALGVSGDYGIALNTRLLLCIAALLAGTVFLFFLARRKPAVRTRILAAALLLLSLLPLWFVWSSDSIYSSSAIVQRDYDREMYKTASKGFLYPFIHSISDAFTSPPEGYDEEEVRSFLDSYADTPIPEDARVNIIAVQLEAFSDLRTMGIDGISEEAYRYYDELKKESISGTLAVNVNGGSTIDTEQCFLTGDYQYNKIMNTYPSFVWYLRNQGYRTVGGHPYYSFYGREYTNVYLGFEDYRFCSTYDGYPDIEQLSPGRNYSDCFFFDSILEQYRLLTEEGENVFSFNVTMQGHGPYSTEEYLFGDSWFRNEECSESTRCILNNYLGSLADTQAWLEPFLEALREDPRPVAVVLYGDHKPWLGDDSSAVTDLGIAYSSSDEEGFLNYYTTDYILWANDAARERTGNDFTGEGPMISTCYLFPLLFENLGWDGCGFCNYLLDRIDTLNVITSNGIYYEGSVFRTGKETLSDASAEALRRADAVQYFRLSVSRTEDLTGAVPQES